jgi:thiosulfate/3-mercaptopyruvate sulfurtransferase
VPQHPPGDFAAKAPELRLRARLADVVRVVRKEDPGVFVDVRSPDEHAGKVVAPPGIQELSIRAGCIPGARSIPWNRAVNEDGSFKSVEELRKLYAEAGIDGKAPVIAYCRIGERSSHTWFVLKFLLGYDARNYDGSWTEYGNAVGVPIENKAGTIWTGK